MCHIIIINHVIITNATINLTTLATRLLGKPTRQFQAIQETRKHARKNLWRAGTLSTRGCARLPRRGEWEGFTEALGCAEGGDDDGGRFGRTRQPVLETGTQTRER